MPRSLLRFSNRSALLKGFVPALLLLAGCAASGIPMNVESPYLPPSSLQKGQILHLATGRLVDRTELLEHLSHFPIVYVGETHDSVDDHAVELAILKGLLERSHGGLALGLEMLQRSYQPEVDEYLQGKITEDRFVEIWQKNWDDSFPYYREILSFARENALPVRALNVGEDLRQAVRGKALDKPGQKSDGLPEMDLEDPYHKALIQSILDAHVMGSHHGEAFYRVQVLWDEAMAETAAEYLKSPEGQGRRLLILAGGNHVRYGIGIPRRLFRRVPLPYAIVLPFPVEIPDDKRDRLMDVEMPDLPMRPADFYWAVGYESLDEPK